MATTLDHGTQLARSPHYEIVGRFETAWLLGATAEAVCVGDFYGDPVVALIDTHERWCAVAGCGVIIYFIDSPFDSYRYNDTDGQWVEIGRGPVGEWWVTGLSQSGERSLRVTLESGQIFELEFRGEGSEWPLSVSPLSDG